MEQVLTQIAVKILSGDSTGSDEIRRTLSLPAKQKQRLLYITWIRIS